MPGDRRIQFFLPTGGEPKKTIAFRRDRAGSERYSQGIPVGEFSREYIVPKLGLQDLSPDWRMQDEDGLILNIESVTEHFAAPMSEWLVRTGDPV